MHSKLNNHLGTYQKLSFGEGERKEKKRKGKKKANSLRDSWLIGFHVDRIKISHSHHCGRGPLDNCSTCRVADWIQRESRNLNQLAIHIREWIFNMILLKIREIRTKSSAYGERGSGSMEMPDIRVSVAESHVGLFWGLMLSVISTRTSTESPCRTCNATKPTTLGCTTAES